MSALFALLFPVLAAASDAAAVPLPAAPSDAAPAYFVDALSCPRPRATPCESGLERTARAAGERLCESVTAGHGPVRLVFLERRRTAGATHLVAVSVRQTSRAAMSLEPVDTAHRDEAPVDAAVGEKIARVCSGIVARAQVVDSNPRPPPPLEPGGVRGGIVDGGTICIAAGKRAADVWWGRGEKTLLGDFGGLMATLAGHAQAKPAARAVTLAKLRTLADALTARLARNESCVRPD